MNKHTPTLYFVFAAMRRKGATHGKNPKTVPEGLEPIVKYFSEFQEKAAVFCHGDKETALAVTECLNPSLVEEHRDFYKLNVIERVWCCAQSDLDPAELEEAKRSLSSPAKWVRPMRKKALEIAISRFPLGTNEKLILKELDGVAFKKEQLALRVHIDEGNIARRGGPVYKLKRWGFLINDRLQGGYVRLDAPPPQ